MICGYFDDEAQTVISVQVTGHYGTLQVILTVDTGFDSDICLPVSTAVSLGLPLGGYRFVQLADGSINKELYFRGQCQIGNLPSRDVNVYITELEDGLIGAGMFQNMRLEINYGRQTVSLVPSQIGIE
ncbi:hypothetical protein FJZ31_12065 [Candidatus Poribacteria bacterium]|nr:hypothetical protein [Candidatus Poribacteria bacterium]